MTLIDRSNTLFLWIIEEILSYDKKSSRIKIVEKMIIIAMYLKKMQNYEDLVNIVAALNSHIIRNLEKTLDRLNQNFRTLQSYVLGCLNR